MNYFGICKKCGGPSLCRDKVLEEHIKKIENLTLALKLALKFMKFFKFSFNKHKRNYQNPEFVVEELTRALENPLSSNTRDEVVADLYSSLKSLRYKVFMSRMYNGYVGGPLNDEATKVLLEVSEAAIEKAIDSGLVKD